MAFTNTEALVVYATIKEMEAIGVNVDYIRRIGAGILADFGVTEEQLDMQLNAIKAGAPYPLPVPEPTPEPITIDAPSEPIPEEPEPVPEEPTPEEVAVTEEPQDETII